MSINNTYYTVAGIRFNSVEEFKGYLKPRLFTDTSEEYYNLYVEPFDDNGYNEKITKTESGLHVIMDGFNGSYVIVGKILKKSLYSLEMTSFADIQAEVDWGDLEDKIYMYFGNHGKMLDIHIGGHLH